MNNYGGFGLPFWKDFGAVVKNEDPYRRMVSAHPTPPGWSGGADAPQWSTGEVLHSEPWLDYNHSQVGHARWRNEMIPLYTWFDLEQSKERTRGKVNGGAAAQFHTPEDYPGNLLFKDWLLHILRLQRLA